MDSEKAYSFEFFNLKALRYLFLIVGGLPVMFWLLLKYPDTPLFIILAITIVPIITGIVLLFFNLKKKEYVTLLPDRLVSNHYGEIPFETIDFLKSSWKLPHPNIIIVLKNGRKIRYPSVSSETNNKNSTRLQSFIEELTDLFLEKFPPPEDVMEDPGSIENIPAEIAENTDTGKPGHPAEAAGGNAGTRKNRKRYLRIALTLCLLAGIGFFFYLNYNRFWSNGAGKPDPEFAAAELENKTARQKAIDFIGSYQRKNGPYYLFTNDTSASVQYLPEALYHNFGSGAGALRNETRSLDSMINHPETTSWNINVLSGDFSIRIKKDMPQQTDSADTWLYFAVMNAPAPADTEKDNNRPYLQAIYSVAIPVYHIHSLSDSLWMNPLYKKEFSDKFSMLKNEPGTPLVYIVGREKEGVMREALFRRWMIDLQHKLQEAGFDISGFKMKVIE